MATRRRTRITVVTGAAVAALALSALPAWAGSGPTAQVDVWPPDPAVTYENAGVPAISDDGRVVVFIAQRVESDTGRRMNHIFARDRVTGETTLVDVATDGTESELTVSASYDVSADGRYVAFVSGSDLAPGNPNASCQPPPEFDPDNDTLPPCLQVYRRDRLLGTTTVVSVPPTGAADASSSDPRISADGTRVVFSSSASNLVADDANENVDIFLWEATTQSIARVSSTDTGAAASGASLDADISGDGRTVVFLSNAPGFTADAVDNSPATNVFVSTDLSVPVPVLSPSFDEEASDPSVNGDGSVVAFMSLHQPVSGQGNWNVFVLDRSTGVITAPSAGLLYADRPQVSSDGLHVLFRSSPLNVYNRETGQTEVAAVDVDGVDLAQADSGFSSISGDGRFVAYWVYSEGVSHVWVHDRGAPAESANGTGSATTDSEGDGATPLDPVETSVAGSSGAVSITDLGPGTVAPTGYRALGQQVSITAAPPASGGFLTITLLLDGEAVPPGTAPEDVSLSRNGALLAACTSGSDVGPCLAGARLVDGDLELVAHSPAASVWAALLPEVVPDREAPTVTISSPLDGANVVKGSSLTAGYSCADTGGSGLVSCVGDVASGTALDTSSVGSRTFSVTAIDGADNRTTTSVSYSIRYAVRGFYSLAAPPVVNDVKAGKVVPLVFSLGGDQGLGVLAGAPSSSQIACPVRPRRDEVESYLGSNAPALSYRASTRRYTAAWPTSRSWKKGTCRDVVVTLVDGSTIRALVRIA